MMMSTALNPFGQGAISKSSPQTKRDRRRDDRRDEKEDRREQRRDRRRKN